MGFLTGKKLLITGVLSNRSIAYGIAKACHAQGAELAFSYVGERFKDRITEFAADFGSNLIFDCDVGDDAQIDKLFKDLSAPGRSSTASCTASASRRARRSPATSSTACRAKISASRTTSAPTASRRMAKAALPYLNDKSALLTLTYLGAIRAIPNYNTMGLAKASLEASVRYLAERRLRPDGEHARQRHQRRARSRRWPPAASRTSASSSASWPMPRRCAATSPSTTSATWRPSC